MSEDNQAEGEKKGGLNSDDLAPVNVDCKKRKPHPATSTPRKIRTQKPPDLITR